MKTNTKQFAEHRNKSAFKGFFQWVIEADRRYRATQDLLDNKRDF